MDLADTGDYRLAVKVFDEVSSTSTEELSLQVEVIDACEQEIRLVNDYGPELAYDVFKPQRQFEFPVLTELSNCPIDLRLETLCSGLECSSPEYDFLSIAFVDESMVVRLTVFAAEKRAAGDYLITLSIVD